MTYRAPPQPTAERARATEELIARGATDLDRWSDLGSLATQWDARAAMAADWIAAGASVLDVGCGAMALGALLKPGSRYWPADVVERRPGAFVADLNAGEFPPGHYDWVSFLGVLEYIHDPAWPLARATEAAPRLIVTYCTYVGGDASLRRGMGWVNDFSRVQFEVLLAQTGWTITRTGEVKRGPTNVQLMWACERTAP